MVLDGTGSVYDDTGWYLVSISWYCLVLGGTWSACMPVYIGKSGDLVGCYRSLTHSQTTEYKATQLVESIKFKLSHATTTTTAKEKSTTTSAPEKAFSPRTAGGGSAIVGAWLHGSRKWLNNGDIINFKIKMENTKQNQNTQIHPHRPVHIG